MTTSNNLNSGFLVLVRSRLWVTIKESFLVKMFQIKQPAPTHKRRVRMKRGSEKSENEER